jgi:hypothetical protein
VDSGAAPLMPTAASLASNRDEPVATASGQNLPLPELSLLRSKVDELARVSSEIGTIPPGPPTPRARLGAILIGGLRRALFWLLTQLNAFHAAVNEIARQQIVEMEKLAAGQRRLEIRLQAANRDLRKARPEWHQTQTETEREKREIRESLREIGDRLSESEYRLKAQEERLLSVVEQSGTRGDTEVVRLKDPARISQPELNPQTLESLLTVLKEYSLGSMAMPILDIGSGAGTWLQMLSAAGLSAAGVEENGILAAAAKDKGVRLVGADPFMYLASLPTCCLGALTALAWIDRLSLSQLITLLDETIRVLKPGGLAVFIDPKADGPGGTQSVASDLARLAQLRGYDEVRVMSLDPRREIVIGGKPGGVRRDSKAP